MPRVAETLPIRSKALVLYEGQRTPHRSCGIALAEAFDRPTPAYQSLRRGGITGQGQCGAVVAGQLLLGEFLGDPAPTGTVTPALRTAMTRYLARVDAELERGSSPTLICNDLTAPHGEFMGPARHRFCTGIVAQVAGFVDEILREHGVEHQPTPVELEPIQEPGEPGEQGERGERGEPGEPGEQAEPG